MVTAVALLLLLNAKRKPESLQRDGRPGWRFPQTAGCKARTFLLKDRTFLFVSSEQNANGIAAASCIAHLTIGALPFAARRIYSTRLLKRICS